VLTPNNTTLTTLVLDPGALAPVFFAGRKVYTASVPSTAASVLVTATPVNVTATVVYSAAPGVCTGNDCTLQDGVNVISVTVISGARVRQYTIEVLKPVQAVPQCFAEINGDATTDFSSADAAAVRSAAKAGW
jgi:hypothetical protein